MAAQVQSPFVWGDNGRQLTPDQVDRLRDRSEAMVLSGMDTSPVGHWSQGQSRMVDAWGGSRGIARADAQEKAGLASARAALSPVVQALMPRANQTPSAAPMGSLASVPPQPSPLGLLGLGSILRRW